MEIYITDSKSKYKLPMLPESISIQTGAVFQSYNIMSVGEVKFPTGENLIGFSWSGILPGKARKNTDFIKDRWKNPKGIQNLWDTYRRKKIKLKLLITETPINHKVYLDSYSIEYKDGYGDYHYQISFVIAKDIKIYKVAKSKPNKKVKNNESLIPKTYVIKPGDSLWRIAEKYLGSGKKYTEIHKKNQPPLGPNPDKIYPGQVIKLR